jgi:hypothetical protein
MIEGEEKYSKKSNLAHHPTGHYRERLNIPVAEADKVVTVTREIVDRFPTVHRMVPILLGAFVFRSWQGGGFLLAALNALRDLCTTGVEIYRRAHRQHFYKRHGANVADQGWHDALPASVAKKRTLAVGAY